MSIDQTKLDRIKAMTESQWMPIDTAPKDGTPVIVTNATAGGSWVAYYKDKYQSGYRPSNHWHSMMLNHEHLPNKRESHVPTLWMPLPPPPTP